MLGVRATPEHPNVCRRPSSSGRTAGEASAAPAPTVGASVLHDCFPKQDTLSGATPVSFPLPQSAVSPVTLTSPLSPCPHPSWQSLLHLVQPSLCLWGLRWTCGVAVLGRWENPGPLDPSVDSWPKKLGVWGFLSEIAVSQLLGVTEPSSPPLPLGHHPQHQCYMAPTDC